ncbi:Cytochrome c oxidase-assembly factor cox-23- mitochondrial [Apiospora phragmitis]|uniref:Cytochrome c oxidase-assembly factor cox-23-mitochondrial n=1 Tax=Apiospora phragmitis TaxID=2905665 RepID=A0ABR1TW26_9PEZI
MSTQGEPVKDTKVSQEGKDGKGPWNKENKNKFQNPEANTSIPAKKLPNEAYDALTETGATERCVQTISSEFRELRVAAQYSLPWPSAITYTNQGLTAWDRAYRNCKKDWTERRRKENAGILW